VIKVLRPGVEALVAEDVRVSQRLVALVERWWPNPHVVGTRVVIQEFAARVTEEMDFRQEAAHAVAIRANFAGSRNIWIPRVIEPMIRQRAIVLEYCPGRRVDRLDEWVAEGRVRPDRLVRDVMELYAKMMLVHGLFHADPHPGTCTSRQTAGSSCSTSAWWSAYRSSSAANWSRRSSPPSAVTPTRLRSLSMRSVSSSPAPTPPSSGGSPARCSPWRTSATRRASASSLLADEVIAELYDWPIVLPSHLVYFARTASLHRGPRHALRSSTSTRFVRRRRSRSRALAHPRVALSRWRPAACRSGARHRAALWRRRARGQRCERGVWPPCETRRERRASPSFHRRRPAPSG
jgi:hypothetical protein